MKKEVIFCGNRRLTRADQLGGILFYDDTFDYTNEIVVIMGGFARMATDEKILLAIAEKAGKPCFIFDWHGLGMSSGNFGDVTVEKLADDLKRIIGMLFAEGFSKFHFVGHSLGACVIALFTKKYAIIFDIGKKILIAPALDQSFLLRYWFARGNNLDFSISNWNAGYKETCHIFHGEKVSLGYDAYDATKCWNHENEFQKYIHFRKNIKDINIDATYWENESQMNYFYHLINNDFLNFPASVVSDRNLFLIFGSNDKSIPLDSVPIGAEDLFVFHADHYFAGEEDNVAKMVNGFLHRK
jgi:pimeloyl-ACP methyl ester carboxylesterase